MSSADKTIACVTLVILIIMICFALDTSTNKPQHAHNLAQYQIHYQRCLSEPGGAVPVCDDIARFKSKVCIGCE